MNCECVPFRVGIIVGTGIEDLAKQFQAAMHGLSDVAISTRYGEVKLLQAKCKRSSYDGEIEVFILPRHGLGCHLPPHLINYKANIAAMKRLQVDGIIATAAVGALHSELSIGKIVIPDQLIDWTKQRPLTFFDECAVAVHVDVTQPYCERLRKLLLASAEHAGVSAIDTGCYICADGPRYETAAEVKAMRILGGDIVGMTAATEAILAREAEVCYALVCVVTNYAAGVLGARPSHSEVVEVMRQANTKLMNIIATSIERYKCYDCPCKHSLDGYGVKAPV
ncbi:MAG: MTAP family purine nucleoside phosphorylase [Armatimonadota bacterium]|nr:MTAP family purine nucleoside phosphorylase [Armatimonadota bacterium]MCX7778342.1 MTAP family purine nucleoside phosphorylase [Armatimonadota bacterium]MDW8026406.1 MTAP family purine nucleoside phosphorylase [Armatimonadota bacterium]